MTKKAKLTCRVFPINEINIAKLVEMHSIFTRFYENADLTTFIKGSPQNSEKIVR